MKKIYLLATGLCLSIALMAQSPGGVGTGLALWIKADAASTLNLTGSNVNTWTYVNNASNSFTYTSGTQATFLSNAINSLPGIGFNGTQMSGPNGANAPLPAGSQAYAVFAVWSTASTASPQRPWAQWDGLDAVSGVGASLWLFDQGVGLEWGDQPEIPPFVQGLGQPVTTGTFYISEMNLLNATSNDLELLDQTNFPTPTVLSTGNGSNARANLSTAVHQLGCRSTSGDEPFNGTLAELIIYDNSVSAGTARNQIFSYLSIKYGIPITGSFVSSAGATVWDAAVTNAGYNNSVFGLAIDNGSGLNVQQSNASTTAGVSGAGNMTVAAIANMTVDQSFLLFGNDGGALTETTSNMPTSAAGSSRLARNWKVQNTNNVGAVDIGFDLAGIPITGTVGNTANFRLMVNTAGDNTFPDATTELYTPTNFTNTTVANFVDVQLPTGSVVGIISNASGSTPLPVDFITFTAQPNGGNVDLAWTVGDNEQANIYEIDRSSDGATFAKIGEVANSASQKSYGYVDEKVGAGTHYYRVLETDLDGKSIYSKVVSATLGAGDFSVAVLNNPAKGSTNAQLQINAVSAGTAFIEVWSVGGARLSLQQEAIGTGTTTISVPMSNLAAGSYVVKVMVGGNTRVTQVVKL